MNASDLVTRLLKLVDEHYILQDRVAALRERIEERREAGRYDSLGPHAFAEAIMREVIFGISL